MLYLLTKNFYVVKLTPVPWAVLGRFFISSYVPIYSHLEKTNNEKKASERKITESKAITVKKVPYFKWCQLFVAG